MKHTYYNDVDAKACAWLAQLANDGHISNGVVHCGSIKDIQPEQLRGYLRAHFFAGIGGWDYALKLAGFPDDRAVWTGSCPCQPFSSAGKRQGQADERHLWPDWFRLIRECRPDTIFGEQVESAIGHGWLDGVFADLEAEGYTCGAVVLGAHSVGAPHIRQRLWWVAHTTSGNASTRREQGGGQQRLQQARGGVDRLAKSANERHERSGQARRGRAGLENDGDACGLGLTRRDGSQGKREAGATCGSVERACVVGGVSDASDGGRRESIADIRAGQSNAAWGRFILIHCGDGKTRRLKRGLSALVDGLPRGVVPSGDYDVENTAEARVTRLKGYGNAIVPACAAAFIRAFMDCEKA